MNKKRKIYLIITIFVLIIISTIVAFDLYVTSILSNVNKEEKVDEKDANINYVYTDSKAHNVINFLLLGVDNDEGDYTSYGGKRSDLIKIISLDYTTKKIKISNIQRDITVYIPGDYQAYGHVNWSYTYGGPKLSLQTINYNLDLDVTKYVVVSYAGFVDIINQLGGIDLNLTSLEAAALNGEAPTNALANHYMVEGTNHFDGHDALSYARQRYIDSDFVRVERQNKVIEAIIDKIKSLSYSSLLTLIKNALPSITTDLDVSEIKKYLLDIMSFDLKDIKKYTWPNNGYDGVYKNKILGGYLLKSYKDQLINLHKFIWETDNYSPSKIALENIKNIYSKYGEYQKE